MGFAVYLTPEARDDLRRLEDFLVETALEHGDFDLPQRALAAIRREMRVLESNPYTCRKVSANPLEREWVIPFGACGTVALFEIVGSDEVIVSALRHQREDDCH
ncbi:MAG: type II toxin-antitoxin system RelE/ParE family toxin [Burkholderiales bacterium]|nr:type II toxin-antitoxin system RelE/ParE family toxin [Burkholderiales bacterium]MDE2396941.1 type II toxin-antitoxin system RelE/ParE family toxin [Burkholderiales bacterium]MDE2454464.1 type II toxin-antitoxin system RelE/ParE family toxin [Burkholderiales bacterium]